MNLTYMNRRFLDYCVPAFEALFGTAKIEFRIADIHQICNDRCTNLNFDIRNPNDSVIYREKGLVNG